MKKAKTKNGCIWFFDDVSITECNRIDDIFHERLLTNANIDIQSVNYSTAPQIFTGFDSWPNTSNCYCWWCHLHFETMPWSIPQSVERTDSGKRGVMLTKQELQKLPNEYNIHMACVGSFCSPVCCIAYIQANEPQIEQRANKKNMFKYMYQLWANTSVQYIPAAYPPYKMMKYGGDLTELEYVNKNRELMRQIC